jgi:hypothetical protein
MGALDDQPRQAKTIVQWDERVMDTTLETTTGLGCESHSIEKWSNNLTAILIKLAIVSER